MAPRPRNVTARPVLDAVAELVLASSCRGPGLEEQCCLCGWGAAPASDGVRSAVRVPCRCGARWYSSRIRVVEARDSSPHWWFGDGFGAGVHAEHERILVWLPARAAIMIDTMMRWDEAKLGGPRQQAPTLEMNWQLTPGPVELDAENRPVFTRNDDANVLLLFPRLAKNMALCVSERQTDPFRGWVGTGRTAKAPLQRAGVFEAPERAQWRDRGYMLAQGFLALGPPCPCGAGERLPRLQAAPPRPSRRLFGVSQACLSFDLRGPGRAPAGRKS